MRTIVIYASVTGFTEQYAQWISEALACPCKPLKGISARELAEFDQVIFGGWIMGGGIMGLEKLRALKAPVCVFAVGSTPAYEEVVADIREKNKLNDTPFYYLVGGFRFEKLALVKRIILKALHKSISKKENRSRQEDFMAKMLGSSFDGSTREQIEPLVACIKQSGTGEKHTDA